MCDFLCLIEITHTQIYLRAPGQCQILLSPTNSVVIAEQLKICMLGQKISTEIKLNFHEIFRCKVVQKIVCSYIFFFAFLCASDFGEFQCFICCAKFKCSRVESCKRKAKYKIGTTMAFTANFSNSLSLLLSFSAYCLSKRYIFGKWMLDWCPLSFYRFFLCAIIVLEFKSLCYSSVERGREREHLLISWSLIKCYGIYTFVFVCVCVLNECFKAELAQSEQKVLWLICVCCPLNVCKRKTVSHTHTVKVL